MEYHILITWEKANISVQEIGNALPDSLSIKDIVMYTWNPEFALNNYAAFYGEKLEDIQYKVDHCGAGAFWVYVIEDTFPQYEERKTSSGLRKVNTHMYDTKMALRKLTGGGHLVHASDSVIEANMNCMSLFSKTMEEVLQWLDEYPTDIDGVKRVNRNVTGIQGWKDWDELFETLEKLTKYVVLRNANTVVNDCHELHGDTDLLVEDYTIATTIAAGSKVYWGKERVLYKIMIAGKEQLVDFRYVGDGYMVKEWEKEIIKTRTRYYDTNVWVPNDDNLKYSVLYHALVHKPFITQDYQEFLAQNFGTKERKKLSDLLYEFMKRKEYDYSSPNDSSVYIHPEFFSKIDRSLVAKAVNRLKLIKYKCGGYNVRSNKQDKKSSKVLYSGFNLVVKILRTIKKGIRKIIH